MEVGAYVAVSAALFALGIVAIVVRRNVLYVLMGIEMILNAANINFVAFARYNGNSLDGQMFEIDGEAPAGLIETVLAIPGVKQAKALRF